VSVEQVGSLGASITISGGSLCIGLVLLIGTYVRKRELLSTLLREHTGRPGPHEKGQQKRPA
jgi:hypothetical protein